MRKKGVIPRKRVLFLVRAALQNGIKPNVMSVHQKGNRCRWILTQRNTYKFQAAVFLYFTTHNALGLSQPSYNHYTMSHLGRVLLGSTVSGWLGFFVFFWLVWLINVFNQPETRLKQLKTHLRDYVA